MLSRLTTPVLAATLGLAIVAAGALAAPSTSSGGSDDVAFARVDLNPSAVAIYGATNTVYSANNARNDISVVNGATCDAANTSGCSRLPPRQDVGVIPSAIAIDQRTRTVYVANNTEATWGSVSVLSAVGCNAANTSRCTHYPHLPRSVRMRFNPSNIAVNQRTNTIYVDGGGKLLGVIDGRHCNGNDTTGCRRALHTVRVAAGAGGVAVNQRTNTIYVVDYFSGLVTVLAGRTCRAGNTSGCDHRRATVKVGRHPFRLTVDPLTDTVYVTNFGARTVSVIDGTTCNARTTTGCSDPPPVLHVGREPEAVAIDGANHLGFVTNAADNSVSVFDASTCDATDTSGCGQRTATRRVGALPAGIAVNQRTSTVYVADNASDTLAVFKATMPAGH